MYNKKSFRFTILITFLLAFAGIASAQGPVLGSPTTTSELEMTALVQTAVQLNMSTAGGATVTGSTATGLFAINFGTVNGFGTTTPSAGVTVTVDGTSGALYSTPINLTPVYSGFATETADITVEAGGSADDGLAREGDSVITVAAVTTPVVVISDAADESLNTRHVGFYIPRGEVAGAKTATLIYTVTIQ